MNKTLIKRNIFFALVTIVYLFSMPYAHAAASGIISPYSPANTTPINPTQFTSTTVTFNWSWVGATEYKLSIGTAPGGCQIYCASQGTGLSKTVTSLPKNDTRIYVRLSTRIGNTTQYNDYVYISYTEAPTLSKPDNGQPDWLFNVINNVASQFSWNVLAGATGVNYRIVVSKDPNFYGFRDDGGNSSCDLACRNIDLIG